jgi:hypothetical protein
MSYLNIVSDLMEFETSPHIYSRNVYDYSYGGFGDGFGNPSKAGDGYGYGQRDLSYANEGSGELDGDGSSPREGGYGGEYLCKFNRFSFEYFYELEGCGFGCGNEYGDGRL